MTIPAIIPTIKVGKTFYILTLKTHLNDKIRHKTYIFVN